MHSLLRSLPAFAPATTEPRFLRLASLYVAAALVFIAAHVARVWLDPYLPPGFPFLTFFPAVIVSGFVLGVPQGVLVAILGLFSSWLFFIEPSGTHALSFGGIIALLLYFFVVTTDLVLIRLMTKAYQSEYAERQRSERLAERQDVMAQELDHRIKNIFATINALITISQRHAGSAEELASRLRDRLNAMGRSNLLLRGLHPGEEADIQTITAQSLEPFGIVGGPRLTAAGPRVALSGPTVVTLGLIFHELGTNAAKYGALSAPQGRIDLRWSVAEASANRAVLAIDWSEHDGPRLEPDENRKSGFGSTLLRRVLNGIGGHAETAFPPEGARISLTLPIGDERGPMP